MRSLFVFRIRHSQHLGTLEPNISAPTARRGDKRDPQLLHLLGQLYHFHRY